MAAELHAAAQAELWEAIDYYEEQVAGLGLDLLAEVEHATNLLGEHPEAGSVFRRGREEVRQWPLERFPYVLFYVVRSSLLIVAVAHTRRRPGFWIERL